MKRIILFILVLLFVFTTTTFAQEWKTYEFKDYYTIAFPEDWTTQFNTNLRTITSTSPKETHRVILDVFPTSQLSLDEQITSIQQSFPKSFLLEENQRLYIDNRDDRWVMSSGKDNGVKVYCFWYLSNSNQGTYSIFGMGKYDDLTTDRKTIDYIISSLKILK